jgi:hypothetical protein
MPRYKLRLYKRTDPHSATRALVKRVVSEAENDAVATAKAPDTPVFPFDNSDFAILFNDSGDALRVWNADSSTLHHPPPHRFFAVLLAHQPLMRPVQRGPHARHGLAHRGCGETSKPVASATSAAISRTARGVSTDRRTANTARENSPARKLVGEIASGGAQWWQVSQTDQTTES